MNETIDRLRNLNRLRRIYKRRHAMAPRYGEALRIVLVELRKRQLLAVGGKHKGDLWNM